MKDFAVADIAVYLAASKNPKYKESISAMYLTFANFLQENDLSLRSLLPEGRPPAPSFRIMRSELTEEGYQLIKYALQKWAKGVTAGKWPATDAGFLIEELQKLRRSKSN